MTAESKVAVSPVQSYVRGDREIGNGQETVMSEAVAPRRTLPILLGAGLFGLVFAGTAALWLHYGTAVFFETIRAGFIACFG
jgi:hypothetical protein